MHTSTLLLLALFSGAPALRAPDMSDSFFDGSEAWSSGNRLNRVLSGGLPTLSGIVSWVAGSLNNPVNEVKKNLDVSVKDMLKKLENLNVTVDDPNNPDAGMRTRVKENAKMAIELGETLKNTAKDTTKALKLLLASNEKALETSQRKLDSTIGKTIGTSSDKLTSIGNAQVGSAKSFDAKSEADRMRYDGVADRLLTSRLTRLQNINESLFNAGGKFAGSMESMKTGALEMDTEFPNVLRDIGISAKELELDTEEKTQGIITDKFLKMYNKLGDRSLMEVAKNYSRSLGAITYLMTGMRITRLKTQDGVDKIFKQNISDITNSLKDLVNKPTESVASISLAYGSAESALNAAEQDMHRALTSGLSDANAAMNQTTILSSKDQETYEGYWGNTEMMLSGKTDGLSADFINGLASMEAGAGGELAGMQAEAAEAALAAGSSSEQSVDALISSAAEVSKHMTATQGSMRSQQDKFKKLMLMDSAQINATMNLLLGFLKQRQASMNSTLSGAVDGLDAVQEDLANENERRLKSIAGSVENLSAADRAALEAQLRQIVEQGAAGSEAAALMLEALAEGNSAKFAMLQQQLAAQGDALAGSVAAFFRIRGNLDLMSEGAKAARKDTLMNATHFMESQVQRLSTIREGLLSQLALAEAEAQEWNLQAEAGVSTFIDNDLVALSAEVTALEEELKERQAAVDDYIYANLLVDSKDLDHKELAVKQALDEYNLNLNTKLAELDRLSEAVSTNTSWISNASDAAISVVEEANAVELENLKAEFQLNIMHPYTERVWAVINATRGNLSVADVVATNLESAIIQGVDFAQVQGKLDGLTSLLIHARERVAASEQRVSEFVKATMNSLSSAAASLHSDVTRSQEGLGALVNASIAEGMANIETATKELRDKLVKFRQDAHQLSKEVLDTIEGYLQAEFSTILDRSKTVDQAAVLVSGRLADVDDIFGKALTAMFHATVALNEATVDAGGTSAIEAEDLKRMTRELSAGVASTSDSSGSSVEAGLAAIQALNVALQYQAARDMASGVDRVGAGAESVGNATRDVSSAIVSKSASLLDALDESHEEMQEAENSAAGLVAITADEMTRLLEVLMLKHASVRKLLSEEHQASMALTASVKQIVGLAEYLARGSQERMAAGFQLVEATGRTVSESLRDQMNVVSRNISEYIAGHDAGIVEASEAATRAANEKLPIIDIFAGKTRTALHKGVDLLEDVRNMTTRFSEEVSHLTKVAISKEGEPFPGWLADMQTAINADIESIQNEAENAETMKPKRPEKSKADKSVPHEPRGKSKDA